MIAKVREMLGIFCQESSRFLWRQFEKDIAFTEAVFERADRLCSRLSKIFGYSQ